VKSDDPLIAWIAEADPARRAGPSGPENSELAYRVRQRVLQAETVPGDIDSPHGSGSTRSRERHRRALPGFAPVVLVAASITAVVVMIGTIALLGHSRQTDTHATAAPGISASRSHRPQSDRAQAQKLYAPVLAFNHSTTQAQKALIQSAPKADAKRIDACQAPYQKQLFSGLISGSNKYKLYSLYEHGTLLEQYQSRVAAVAPQLTVAAQSWARMQLSNRKMQAFAHALAAELYASLRAPKFDSCAFLNGIAQHRFSLAWAQSSSYGTIARHFWNEISAAGNEVARFVVEL
jgi:hypothetical protein